jgi:hypothetical protein
MMHKLILYRKHDSTAQHWLDDRGYEASTCTIGNIHRVDVASVFREYHMVFGVCWEPDTILHRNLYPQSAVEWPRNLSKRLQSTGVLAQYRECVHISHDEARPFTQSFAGISATKPWLFPSELFELCRIPGHNRVFIYACRNTRLFVRS